MTDMNQRPSGEHPATKNEAQIIAKAAAAKSVFAMVAAVVAGTGGAIAFTDDRADRAAEVAAARVVEPVRQKVEVLTVKLDSTSQAIQDQKAETREVRNDIRAMYRALQYGKDEPKLERDLPPVDAGRRDAGHE